MNEQVDMWYILDKTYQWFTRDNDRTMFVWSKKPVFIEEVGWECDSTNVEVMHIVSKGLVNIRFPEANLEERPNAL